MSENLGDFFSLIGSEKKKQEKKKKDLIGEVSLSDLFAELSEEKKKIKNEKEKKILEDKEIIGEVTLDSLFESLSEEKKKEKQSKKIKEEKLKKIEKDIKVFESFIFGEESKYEKSVETLEKELLNLKNTSYKSIDRLMKGICAEYNITTQKLHNDFKSKHGMIPDEWVKENSVEKLPKKQDEEIVKEVVENKKNSIEKSVEILDKLIPDEEKIDDENDSEINRLKREMDQLRKMVYETVRTATAQGGGGEVRIEFMDDVDRDKAKVNNRLLMYDGSLGKWVGISTSEVARGDIDGAKALNGLEDVTITDRSDFDVLTYDEETNQFVNRPGVRRSVIRVTNNTSSTITKGSAVYQTEFDYDRNMPAIDLADASNTSKMPVIGLSFEDILPNKKGYVIVKGRLDDVSTSDFSPGTEVYVSTSVGILTDTKPRYTNLKTQQCGTVLKTGISTGSIYVDISPIDEFTSISDSLVTDRLNLPTFNDGDVIVYSQSAGGFIATSASNVGIRTTLVSLDDVVGTPTTNNVLIFNGDDFEFTTPFEIMDRSDGTDDDTLDYGSF